jgi:hypothetical protein
MDVVNQERQRRQELERKKAENALLDRQASEAERQVLEAADKLGIGQEALVFLERVANARRGAMKGKIESVVTEALRLVYGPDYRIELTYSMKNNRSCLDIELVRDIKAGEVRRDMDGFGGGVADTISVPMRLLVLIGSKQTDRFCALDECWKHIDPERVELVAKFLRTLSDGLGIQLLVSSHHERMIDAADKAYHVRDDGGRSVVEVV